MDKAAREAKVHTSWTTPDEQYDAALRSFVERSLSDETFVRDVERFVEPLIRPGRINSLAQTLIKLTAPGIPDLYQGTELWSHHLVDPDNRQPVDYQQRWRVLAALAGLSPAEMWRRADEGFPKMWVVSHALQLRLRRGDVFGANAVYTPVFANGPAAAHVIAFVRGGDVMTVVPRLAFRTSYDATTIPVPAGVWQNVLTGNVVQGGSVPLQELWRDFPVALLEQTAP